MPWLGAQDSEMTRKNDAGDEAMPTAGVRSSWSQVGERWPDSPMGEPSRLQGRTEVGGSKAQGRPGE